MKLKPGPRPWSIHVFAIALFCVAVIGLTIALSEPLLEWFKWSKRLPMIPWTQDGAIIAAFSVFTMALFPLVWIYGYGSLRARWVVLTFAIMKAAAWSQGVMVTTLAGWAQTARWFEPALTALAVAMMFAPASGRWLRGERKAQLDDFT